MAKGVPMRKTKKCNVEWCDVELVRADYCSRHLQQIRKWGEVRRSRGDKNEIIIYDDYAEIILYDMDYNEKTRAIIDVDDVEKCKPYKWVFRNDGYVSAKINGKGVKLHRFIGNTPNGMHTDHINRDRLDNRKSNLRICHQYENNLNKNTYKNNKSGRRGVEIRNGRYISAIKFHKKDYNLGSFDTFEEAVRAREEAELKFYGYILEDM